MNYLQNKYNIFAAS